MSGQAIAQEKAIFAGGCFWCMQPAFDNTEGVLKTAVGYTGGDKANPTYQEVSSGDTGHVEAIEVEYDPAKVSYDTLLQVFWENIDPFDEGGQFADRGSQYHTGIFYANEQQKAKAEASKQVIETKFPGKQVKSFIRPAMPFYPAEDYHQQYYQKNATHYTMYKYGSGRVKKLEELWDKHPEAAQ